MVKCYELDVSFEMIIPFLVIFFNAWVTTSTKHSAKVVFTCSSAIIIDDACL